MLAWLTFLTVQTVQYERSHPATLPPPSVYAGAAAAFGILGFVAQPAPGPAAAMAWALVVAGTISNRFDLQPAAAGAGTPHAPTPQPRSAGRTSSGSVRVPAGSAGA